ncbi:MAG TPA: hypothetical protein VGL11_09910 [Candidatus Binatia bacterium]|jgi:hypothetical protein
MAERKTTNELGFKTTYQQFLDREGLPVIRAFHVEDVRDVELFPWNRTGGNGVYLNLEGTEGVNDCYIAEIPPGKSLQPQKKMFEEELARRGVKSGMDEVVRGTRAA